MYLIFADSTRCTCYCIAGFEETASFSLRNYLLMRQAMIFIPASKFSINEASLVNPVTTSASADNARLGMLQSSFPMLSCFLKTGSNENQKVGELTAGRKFNAASIALFWRRG